MHTAIWAYNTPLKRLGLTPPPGGLQFLQNLRLLSGVRTSLKPGWLVNVLTEQRVDMLQRNEPFVAKCDPQYK